MSKSKYDSPVDHSADKQLPPDPAPKPPEPPAAPRPETIDKPRLRELRIAQGNGTLAEGDRDELARLSALESDAAGHVTAPEGRGADDDFWFMDGIMSLLEQIIDTVPALAAVRPRVTQLRARYEEVHPVVDENAISPDKG